ncbi:hypothetical protein E24_00243 [Faustovirus]|nr:hypothetical protein PRJ_Fausto_00228 [Faustovirus]AMN83171.1 hypothetical protein E24_00243 [Faustovirus]AMN85140.1 hypothetical protein E23_00242 [Faustovirus]QBR99136.1 hypothetical protein [Faustovirus mariensis]
MNTLRESTVSESTCVACRINTVTHIPSATCDGCDKFICGIINPAMESARQAFADKSPKIGYISKNNIFTIEVDVRYPAATCVQIRDHICRYIGINIDKSKRINGYIVRIKRLSPYKPDNDYAIPSASDTWQQVYTSFQLFALKRNFKLSYLAAQVCVENDITGDNYADLNTIEQIAKFKDLFTQATPSPITKQ